jgi:hypothetical protein
MASIQISNLCPAGFNLFSDSESFMDELVEREQNAINGGVGSPTPYSPWCYPTLSSRLCEPVFPRPIPNPLPIPTPMPEF